MGIVLMCINLMRHITHTLLLENLILLIVSLPKMTKFEKNPDEIVLEDVKMVHYETMQEGRAVWLGIYLNNGKMYHLNIGGDNLYVNYSYEGTINEWQETGDGV